jgi:ribosomal protein S18 acetylase RimI-like enzyme
MKITIRPARKDESRKLSDLVFVPGEEVLSWFYGDAYKALVQEAVSADNTPFSWDHILVAEFEGEISGLILHYPYGGDMDMNKRFISLLKRHVGFFGIIKVYLRERKWEKNVKKPKDSYYVEVISIKKRFRRKGIGTALLFYVEALAKKQGFKNLVLEVEASNTPAVKSYEKFGFRKFSATPIGRFVDGQKDDVWVMSKRL